MKHTNIILIKDGHSNRKRFQSNYAIIRGILEGEGIQKGYQFLLLSQNVRLVNNLLDWDLLVNLFDLNALFPTVIAEAEIDGCSHKIVDQHEDHRANVRPANGIRAYRR